jgi:hypothetical protein
MLVVLSIVVVGTVTIIHAVSTHSTSVVWNNLGVGLKSTHTGTVMSNGLPTPRADSSLFTDGLVGRLLLFQLFVSKVEVFPLTILCTFSQSWHSEVLTRCLHVRTLPEGVGVVYFYSSQGKIFRPAR